MLAFVSMAERLQNCKKLILKLDRPDRIATIQMLIKDRRRKMKTDNTIEAALDLCDDGRPDSNLNIWILGTACIMIENNI